MFRKIIWRLTFSYLLVILFAMGLMGFFLLTSLESYFKNNLEATLLVNAQLVSNFWEPYFVEKSLSIREERLVKQMTQRLAVQSASRIRIIDRDQNVLMDTSQKPADPVENRAQIVRALNGDGGSEALPSETQGGATTLSVACPIKRIKGSSGDEQVVGVVYTTRSLVYVREILGSLGMEYGVGIFFSLFALGLLSLFLSAYISKPIREITRATEKILEGDLTYRVTRKRKDEIGELARRFDLMRERLKGTLAELLDGKNKLSAVLSNMADGVLVYGRDGNIMMINGKACEFLDSFDLKRTEERFKEDASPPFSLLKKIMEKSLIEGSEETEVVRGFSGNRVIEVSVSPLTQESGEFSGIVLILHDITQLQRLDDMKTEFVTNVSHELKTPLASIKGFAELLLDGALEEKENARNFLSSINNEVDRLTRMVRSLLDLSKMESGLIRMEVHTLPLAPLVEGVLAKLSPQARNLEVNVITRFHMKPLVWGNSDRVEQVLINLIDNALRYSPPRSTLSVEIHRTGDFSEVRVIDEGPGLSEEDKKRVFERFYRVDKARSRDHGGSGLGLAITRQIIENLGGKIWVVGTSGSGCTFCFTLPMAAESIAEAPDSKALQS